MPFNNVSIVRNGSRSYNLRSVIFLPFINTAPLKRQPAQVQEFPG